MRIEISEGVGKPIAEAPVVRGVLALQRDREQAKPIIELLLAGAKSWEDLSSWERRFLGGIPLVDLSLKRSFEFRYKDPGVMLSLAKKARLLTDGISPRRYGRKVLADLKARAWAELGNAHRVAGDMFSAEEAFGRAALWARKGTGDLRLAARIADVVASLYKDQRRFGEAGELLNFVQFAYETLGEFHLAGRTLISRGILAGNNGEPEQAIALLTYGLHRIQPEQDRKLERHAMHALALNLVSAGLYAEARALLEFNRRFFRREKSRLNQLRFHWVEGRIAAGLGEYGKAEASFHVARLGFRQAEQFYDSALVSLDLALVYAKLGRRLEIRRLAEEMITTFRGYRIAREAIASLVLLRKTCDQEGASMDLLRGQIETLSLMLAELERRPARGRRG